MGNKNSGPRSRPTLVKKLHGVTRKDRLNPLEPQLDPAGEAFEVPPNEIAADQVAVAEWTRVVPILRKVGLVSELERAALIALCHEWSRYVAAWADPDAGADTHLKNCFKLWTEMGFTPSGRSRMIALKQPEAPVAAKWAGML